MSVHFEGDNDSTRSSTQDSTSTYWYGGSSPPHEAFDTFQHKVLALTRSICDAEEVTLQRVRGGSYNRVVVAHLKLVDQGELSGIFRIPRDRILPKGIERNSSEDIEVDIHNQVAVLQLLHSKSIPAPTILAYDATGHNPIESPYVFLHFSEGKMLENIYGDMTVQEKMQVAESLADFLAGMEVVNFEECGIVVASQTDTEDLAIKASNFSTPLRTMNAVVSGFTDPYENVHTSHSSTSVRELLSQLLRARLDAHRAMYEAEGPSARMWPTLLKMLEEMCGLGFFEEDGLFRRTSVLYHWDLEPRNLLVKKIKLPQSEHQALEERLQDCLSIETSPETWTIDIAVDWDKVQAVPPVLARLPPIWLWDFPSEKYSLSLPPGYDYDADLQPDERYDSSKGMLSPESQQIQTKFEERFVSNMQQIYPSYTAKTYQDEAYGRGRWIRRMARFALNGFKSSEDWKRFQGLEKEWNMSRSSFATTFLTNNR